MKNGWQTKTIDQISTNLDSRRIPITKAARTRGEYPYYGASGVVDFVAEYIFDEDALLISEDGANLLARSTPIAFPVSGKYWVNNHAHIIKFEHAATQRFVELYLESIPLDAYVTGAAQPKLNQKALNSIPIPYPPLPEQQRIIDILDEALEGVATAKANAEKNLENARVLFESELNAVFSRRGDGWVETTVDELIESNVIGLTKGSRDQGEGKAWPYVKMNNITRDNRFDFSRFTCIDATQEEVSKFSLRDGDFLFNTRNSYELVGKSCIYVSDSNDTVLFNNNIMRVRFKSVVDARFVLLAFSSTPVRNELNALKSGTTNVSAIYFKDLKSLVVPVPPIAEQKAIAEKLEALSDQSHRLKIIYQSKIEALDKLKKSLLHEAFSGNL
jgi:type I restriction enzyme, S subunit